MPQNGPYGYRYDWQPDVRYGMTLDQARGGGSEMLYQPAPGATPGYTPANDPNNPNNRNRQRGQSGYERWMQGGGVPGLGGGPWGEALAGAGRSHGGGGEGGRGASFFRDWMTPRGPADARSNPLGGGYSGNEGGPPASRSPSGTLQNPYDPYAAAEQRREAGRGAGGGFELDQSRATEVLDELGRPVRLRGYGREELGGPSADNVWEQLALGRFEGGFDPGAGQFQGDTIDRQVYSEAQINQLAQRSAEPTVRAFNDAMRQYADAAGRSGSFDPSRFAALKSMAALESAGAMGGAIRDATLDAARLNAEQQARAAANQRANFETDLAARLGLGRLGLDEAQSLLGAGLERRGLDQTRDIARFQGGISQRGQDLERDYRQAGLNLERQGMRLGGEMGLTDQQLRNRGLSIDEQLGQGRLDLERELGLGRLGLEGQELDLRRDLGFAGLGEERYRTDVGAQQAQAERQNRLQMLDMQLQDSSLDRQTRAELERERMALQREITGAERAQRESEFSRSLASGEGRFDRSLGEETRQFDATQALQRELASQNRDYGREQRAAESDRLNRALGLNLLGEFGPYSDPYQMMDLLRQIEQSLAGGYAPPQPFGWNWN